MRAMNEKACRGNDCAGSDNKHADAIDSGADDFHELPKIFHGHVQWPKGHAG